VIAASRKPDLFTVDCAVTTDGTDRLLLLAPYPIPEGGMAIDPRFFVNGGELRPHQVRLEGGDASSDSYCYA